MVVLEPVLFHQHPCLCHGREELPVEELVPEAEGLGLAIANRIAAAHRADLRIESEVGKGTVVEVVFVGAEGA